MCEVGLADPAHPSQRHQPVGPQRRFDLSYLSIAPDEAWLLPTVSRMPGRSCR
jgi:hypothetical protein